MASAKGSVVSSAVGKSGKSRLEETRQKMRERGRAGGRGRERERIEERERRKEENPFVPLSTILRVRFHSQVCSSTQSTQEQPILTQGTRYRISPRPRGRAPCRVYGVIGVTAWLNITQDSQPSPDTKRRGETTIQTIHPYITYYTNTVHLTVEKLVFISGRSYR